MTVQSQRQSQRRQRLLNVALGLGLSAIAGLVAFALFGRGTSGTLVEAHNTTAKRAETAAYLRPPLRIGEAPTPRLEQANTAYHAILTGPEADVAVAIGRPYQVRPSPFAAAHTSPPARVKTSPACRALGLPERLPHPLRDLSAETCQDLSKLSTTWTELNRACYSVHHRSPLDPWDTTWPDSLHDIAQLEPLEVFKAYPTKLVRLNDAALTQAVIDLASGNTQRGLERWACAFRFAQDIGQTLGPEVLRERLRREEFAWEALYIGLQSAPEPLTDRQLLTLEQTLDDLAQTPYDLGAVLDGLRLRELYGMAAHDPTGLNLAPKVGRDPNAHNTPLFNKLMARLETPGVLHGFDVLDEAIAAPVDVRGDRLRAVIADLDMIPLKPVTWEGSRVLTAHTLIQIAQSRWDITRLLIADARFAARTGAPAATVADLIKDNPKLPSATPLGQTPYAFATHNNAAVIQAGPQPEVDFFKATYPYPAHDDDTAQNIFRVRRLVQPQPTR